MQCILLSTGIAAKAKSTVRETERELSKIQILEDCLRADLLDSVLLSLIGSALPQRLTIISCALAVSPRPANHRGLSGQKNIPTARITAGIAAIVNIRGHAVGSKATFTSNATRIPMQMTS